MERRRTPEVLVRNIVLQIVSEHASGITVPDLQKRLAEQHGRDINASRIRSMLERLSDNNLVSKTKTGLAGKSSPTVTYTITQEGVSALSDGGAKRHYGQMKTPFDDE